MEPYRRWTAPALIATADDPSRTRADRLHARLALVAGGVSPPQALLAPIGEATPEELRVIAGELAPHRGAMLDRLWAEAKAPEAGGDGRFRAACALAALDPDAPGWSAIAPGVAATLLAENPLRVKPWVDILRPARRWLAPPIADLARSPTQSEGPRMLATDIVVDYAADDPALLADLAQDADPRQLALILPRLAADGGRAVAALRSVFRAAGAGGIDDASAVRRANAAAALYLLGAPDAAWSLLGTADDPRPESELIHALTARAVDPSPIVAKLAETREPAARRTLLLALADLAESLPEPTRRDRLIPGALSGYRDDPDPGVHAATRLLLRRLGRDEDARAIDRALEGAGRPGDRAWFVEQGHTMVVIDPIGRDPRLSSHRPIDRVFAISDTEVTLGQFRRFLGDHPGHRNGDGPDAPAANITWYKAAAYCRWLDEREGVPEDQRCYPPIDRIKEGMVLNPGYLRRTGHRLPTYAEWSYAGRGGAMTDRYYGNRNELLPGYARFKSVSTSAPYAVGRLKPNAFGLFDTLGGLFEWCDESVEHCNAHPSSDVEDLTRVTSDRDRVIRGGSYVNDGERILPDRDGSDRAEYQVGQHRLPRGPDGPGPRLTRATGTCKTDPRDRLRPVFDSPVLFGGPGGERGRREGPETGRKFTFLCRWGGPTMSEASPKAGAAPRPKLVSTSKPFAAGGYCIWEYSRGAWAIKTTSHARGYHPGDPPSQPGRFEGELVKKHCEAAAVPSYSGPKALAPARPGPVTVTD